MADRGTVVQVVDGDTFRTAFTIRLANVDAPERGEPGGLAAAMQLARLVGGREVVYQEKARDIFGRIVAQVWVDGVDVNAAMQVFVSRQRILRVLSAR